jgi:hypothetical protein
LIEDVLVEILGEAQCEERVIVENMVPLDLSDARIVMPNIERITVRSTEIETDGAGLAVRREATGCTGVRRSRRRRDRARAFDGGQRDRLTRSSVHPVVVDEVADAVLKQQLEIVFVIRAIVEVADDIRGLNRTGTVEAFDRYCGVR